eukprot:TRINITY_DN9730_c0_g1_i1.p1 TRINITY_DN9730_c0_g1~~TRINITY_DN9730_c0_g1_i1.p1  ORF type:complete len:139 (-),score=29.39 TRINITY_DN9730_c0_g1_i1:4-420(-)
MELMRALDLLGSCPVNEGKEGDLQLYSRDEKILAIRVVCEQICLPALRSSSEFPRFISVGISMLLHIHGDKDMNVWAVAEENLNKLIKTLIYFYSERILIDLYKGIKSRETVRSTKAALAKFADVCHFMNPNRSRTLR